MAAPAYGLTGSNDAINQALMGNTLAFSGYAQPGLKANNLQAAYSGALGAPAQQQAFQNFTASPGQEWLRQQAEQGTLRNAAAIGGLGGGNVQQELQRQAMGLAQQDFQNQFNNLNTVSGQGLQALNSAGGFNSQLQGQKAGYAYGAGQDIANNRAATTSALNGLYGNYTSNIANLLTGAGGAQAQSNQTLASLLANLATGSQNAFVAGSGLPNAVPVDGALKGIGEATAGAAALLALSDARLKTNINRVGTTAGGNALYTWDWTPQGKALAGAQPAFGVIAQEVNQDAVVMGSDGWLRVDYTRVL